MLIWPKKAERYKNKDSLPYIKMDKEILWFGDIKVQKYKFYCYESPTF